MSSANPTFLTARELASRLDVVAAADALADAFRTGVSVEAPQRSQLPMGDATFLTMPAAGVVHGRTLAGAKMVTVRPDNREFGRPSLHATYVLFGGPAAAPLAILDGYALTNLRTSAVSALATRLLADPGASVLVIFGAGAMAHAHLEAMCAVRPIREVIVVGRDAARAEALVCAARARDLVAHTGTPGDVALAAIVCTCTTSATPLFDGSRLAAGAHVNAVGSFQPHTRELDDATVRRGRVVVEDRAAALAEAGDLRIPLESGVLGRDAVVADLGELCSGHRVRRSREEVTVFKSVGLAMEDLVVAAAAVAE
jgi:ornithine cyclodeaminase